VLEELTPPPKWEPQASRLIDEASRHIRLLGCVTPVNLRAELAALHKAYDSGKPRLPRFEYRRADYAALVNHLERGAALLEALPQDDLKSLYIDRARELTIEAKLCMMVGTEAFRGLANQRYPRRDSFDGAADELCHEWLQADDGSDDAADPELTIRSDDGLDPRSLLSQMGAMVGARKLPIRVVVSTRLSALAATGPGAVYIATGHMLTPGAAHRTVLHEIEGHVMPRIRAAQAALGIFQSGTRYGSDDQEGRALCIEDEAGFLLAARRAELARRHLACRMVGAGASFVDTTHALLELKAPLSDALRIAARAHRGGGLGRERVYLPAMLRIREIRNHPSVDAVLANGRVSVDAVSTLRPWVNAPSSR
jgi:hypothetical protein